MGKIIEWEEEIGYYNRQNRERVRSQWRGRDVNRRKSWRSWPWEKGGGERGFSYFYFIFIFIFFNIKKSTAEARASRSFLEIGT